MAAADASPTGAISAQGVGGPHGKLQGRAVPAGAITGRASDEATAARPVAARTRECHGAGEAGKAVRDADSSYFAASGPDSAPGAGETAEGGGVDHDDDDGSFGAFGDDDGDAGDGGGAGAGAASAAAAVGAVASGPDSAPGAGETAEGSNCKCFARCASSTRVSTIFGLIGLRMSEVSDLPMFRVGRPSWVIGSATVPRLAEPVDRPRVPAAMMPDFWPPLATQWSVRSGTQQRRAIQERATDSIRTMTVDCLEHSGCKDSTLHAPQPPQTGNPSAESRAENSSLSEAASLLAETIPDMRSLIRPFVAVPL